MFFLRMRENFYTCSSIIYTNNALYFTNLRLFVFHTYKHSIKDEKKKKNSKVLVCKNMS
jgi:hypothetical protein